MSERKFLPILGVFFVCGSLLCGSLTWYSSNRAASRVERLTPVPVGVLEDSQPGLEVLVEGRVSSRNPVQYWPHGFVAYIREGREIYTNDKGTRTTGSWTVRERVTPPLLLELPDGLVQIGNSSYNLGNATTIEEQPSFGRESDIRYRGLKASDHVIAVGALFSTDARPQIDAEFIALGTQAEYIAGQRTGGVIICVFSVVVAIVGGVLIFWGLVGGLRPRWPWFIR
jgi:hypothetical protein